MKLHNKIIIVTGAGSGIGRALAEELLQKGAKVAAVDLHKESLTELQEKAGPDIISIHGLDISDKKAVQALPHRVIKHHGVIDGVINCAGIIQPFEKINDLSYDAIEKVMNVNFYGTLYMTKTLLPHLLKRPEAYVANFSSMGGFLPVPGQGIYGASKAAIKLFTESLYAELLYTNVHVSTIFPGATQTNISKNSGVGIPSAKDTKNQSFPMLSAQQVARSVIRGMEKNKPLIYTGKDAKTMNKLYRLSPVYAIKLITRKMKSLLR